MPYTASGTERASDLSACWTTRSTGWLAAQAARVPDVILFPAFLDGILVVAMHVPLIAQQMRLIALADQRRHAAADRSARLLPYLEPRRARVITAGSESGGRPRGRSSLVPRGTSLDSGELRIDRGQGRSGGASRFVHGLTAVNRPTGLVRGLGRLQPAYSLPQRHRVPPRWSSGQRRSRPRTIDGWPYGTKPDIVTCRSAGVWRPAEE